MANEIVDAFNSAWDDGPVGAPTRPKKEKIRLAGAVIQARVDSLASVTNGKWATFLSQSEMNAQLNYSAGTEARNYNAPGRGVYRKTGAAGTGSWTYIGPIPEGDTTTLNQRVTPQLSMSGVVIEDRANLLGGGAAVYIPTGLYYAGMVSKTLTPADTKVTTHYKVALANGTDVASIYYDLIDDSVKTAVFPTVMPSDPARYFHIATFYGAGRGVAGSSKVVSTRSGKAQIVGSYRPICLDMDRGVLMVPNLAGYDASGGTFILDPVDAGAAYRELTVPRVPADVAVRFVWIDLADLKKNGGNSPNALKLTSGYSQSANPAPSSGDANVILLGTIFNEMFVPAGDHFLSVATTLPCQSGVGKEDNDQARFKFNATRSVALKRAESLALGFTRGYAASAPNEAVYRTFYGDLFDRPMKSGYVYARWYIETDTAGSFGSSTQGYSIDQNGNVNLMQTVMIGVVRQISENLREYEGWFRIISAADRTNVGCWVGFDHSSLDVARMFGVQYAADAKPMPYVARNDYPRNIDAMGNKLAIITASSSDPVATFQPMIPPLLPIVEGRPALNIYLAQMFDQVSMTGRGTMTLTRSAPTGLETLIEEASPAQEAFRLPAAALPSGNTALTMEYLDNAAPGNRKSRSVTVRKVTAAQVSALSFNLLCIGDSLTDWNGTVLNGIRRLLNAGAAIQMIGTLQMTGFISGVAAGLGEGRSGKRFSDYVNLTNTGDTAMTAVAAGGEAAYLALSEADKRTRNPFLKDPVTDDTTNRPGMIKNGKIFDPQFYMSRFSFPNPNLVYINLGTNDISLFPTAAEAQDAILQSAAIMIPQFRRQYPNAKIIVAWNPLGRTSGGDDRWRTKHLLILRALQAYLQSLNDGSIFLFPAYCLVSRESSFQYGSATTDVNGIQSRSVTDVIHYGNSGVMEFGEAVAQFIAAVMAS